MTATHPRGGGVVITLDQIYRKLVSVERLANATSTDVKMLRECYDRGIADHETRLDALEETRLPWKLIGRLVGVGGLIVAIVAILVKG